MSGPLPGLLDCNQAVTNQPSAHNWTICRQQQSSQRAKLAKLKGHKAANRSRQVSTSLAVKITANRAHNTHVCVLYVIQQNSVVISHPTQLKTLMCTSISKHGSAVTHKHVSQLTKLKRVMIIMQQSLKYSFVSASRAHKHSQVSQLSSQTSTRQPAEFTNIKKAASRAYKHPQQAGSIWIKNLKWKNIQLVVNSFYQKMERNFQKFFVGTTGMRICMDLRIFASFLYPTLLKICSQNLIESSFTYVL